MESFTTVCADCDAKSPQWASINRGVFVCDECNSIHRQLGRHVSQTKHLTKSLWRPSQLFMVQYLALAGANRFWEHILLEPFLNKNHDEIERKKLKLSKKPQPDSLLHSTKSEFIIEKYLFHGFFKPPQVVYPDDLNLQLHASVRTAVLETSLYLLALGASPNFIHPAKGTSPVHVACQYEQLGQLELLIAYGGDICLRSTNGISPIEIALEKAQKSQGGETGASSPPWSPLIECILSTFYELTDGLSFYLCRRVPDHQAAVFSSGCKLSTAISSAGPSRAFYGSGHFLIASDVGIGGHVGENAVEPDHAWLAEAKAKLKQLENSSFEDLCIDVYDEAERRLTNTILEPLDIGVTEAGVDRILPLSGRPNSASVPNYSAKHSLALFFLPPNTAYSSVRNQARQKLGRLSMTEFRALVVDVLTEAAARLVPLVESSQRMMIPQSISQPPLPQPKRMPQQHNYISYELPPPVGLTAERHSPRLIQLINPLPRQHHGVVNEDPVYDQVASEQDTMSQRDPSRTSPKMNSTSTSISNGAMTPSLNRKTSQPSPDPSRSELSLVLDSLSIIVSDPASRADEEEEDLPRLSPYRNSPGIGGGGIESKPGPVPGSRRLHLPHTGRLSSFSVPTDQLNRITQTSPSAELKPQSIAKPLQRSVEVQVSQPCDDCPTLRETLQAELDRLQAAKSALEEHQVELTDEKEKLEKRFHQLEITAEQLKEANEALKAALSAGLVMSHQRSESSTPVVPAKKVAKESSSLSVNSSTTPSPANGNGDPKCNLKLNEEDEDYSYNEDVSSVRANFGGGGAYSMGTECLDSGILLRQGIWGTPVSPPLAPLSEESRAPSKVSPNSRATFAVPTASCSSVVQADSQSLVAVPGAQRSYVNLTSKSGSRQMANNAGSLDSPISLRTRPPEADNQQPLTAHHEVADDVTDDYTAPNETGSPSPAPLPPTTAAAYPRTGNTGGLWCLPHVTSSNQQRPSLKSPEGADYVIPGTSPHLQYNSSNSPISATELGPPLAVRASPLQWKQPPYERIVRGVERIIVCIRSLLDAANARRPSDLVRPSQAIQAAVQDLVVLFPPISKCHGTVGSALTTLMSNSQKLRLFCERNLGASGRKIETENPLINFAHQIASAAKTILTFFQGERQ